MNVFFVMLNNEIEPQLGDLYSQFKMFLNFAEFIFLKQVNPFHAQCPSGTAFYNQVQPIKGREGVNVSGLGVRRCVCGGGGGG